MKFVLATILFSLSAVAAKQISEPAYFHNCDAKLVSRTEEMLCLDVELMALDRAMSVTYRKIFQELGSKCGADADCEKLKSNLQGSQRAWLKYRDSFCELETVHIMDSVESDQQYIACLKNQTLSKTEELHIQKLNFRDYYRGRRVKSE